MMQSFGRYAAVVWSACLVAGQILPRIPRVLTDVLCGTAALLLVIFAAMFSARYFIVWYRWSVELPTFGENT